MFVFNVVKIMSIRIKPGILRIITFHITKFEIFNYIMCVIKYLNVYHFKSNHSSYNKGKDIK